MSKNKNIHLFYNEAIRDKLIHEHSVMKHRIGWHHVIQVFMLTAFYKIYYSNTIFCGKLWILPTLGIVYSFSALYSLWVSEKARACIFMHWNRYRKKNGLDWEDFPPVSGDPLPHIRDSKKDPTIFIDMDLKCYDRLLASKCWHWFMLYKFIPILFIILWFICLYEVCPFEIILIKK